MALRGFALVPLCLSLSSCALFNPYVQSTQSVVDTVPNTGTDQAQRMKIEFKNKTNQLAYWQSGTAAAFAGALGLGGYRAVTGDHAHQVAALTAGSAALYGFSAAQYKPTKEQIYHRGVEAVVCLESIYEPSSANTGLSLIDKIYSIKVRKGTRVTIQHEELLLSAISTAEEYDRNYRQNLSEVSASMNKYLASLQPPPEITYRIISDAISRTVPQQGQKNIKFNDQPPIPPADKITIQAQPQNPADVSLVKTLELKANNWINNVTATQEGFDASAKGCNPFQGQPPAILGIQPGQLITIQVGEKETFRLTHSSGDLSFTHNPQADSDTGAVTTKVVTENKDYWLEVEGVKATTKPVKAYVQDRTKEITIDFHIEVKGADPAPETEDDPPANEPEEEVAPQDGEAGQEPEE